MTSYWRVIFLMVMKETFACCQWYYLKDGVIFLIKLINYFLNFITCVRYLYQMLASLPFSIILGGLVIVSLQRSEFLVSLVLDVITWSHGFWAFQKERSLCEWLYSYLPQIHRSNRWVAILTKWIFKALRITTLTTVELIWHMLLGMVVSTVQLSRCH